MKLTKLIAAVLIAVVALLSYQKGFAYTGEESFQRTIPQQEATLLEVKNVNGNIQVSSWVGDSVKIEAVKKVKTPNREKAEKWLKELEIQVVRSDKEISVKTISPRRKYHQGFWDFLRGRRVRWSVDYTITVPVNLDLQLDTTNGNVEAGGVKGEVEAQSTNGNVRITEVEGSALGQSTNGSVKIKDIEGDAIARSTNGSVELLGIVGSVQASTTNGSVKTEITSAKLEKDCHLSTTNGSISVNLPADISVDIDARTTNGKVRVQLPVTIQGEINKRRLQGKINQGGPLLWVRTTNGNITVEKGTGREGKVEAPSIPEEKREFTHHQERWDWELPLSEEFDIWPMEKEGWEWDAVGRFNRVEGLALGLKVTACPTPRGQDKVYIQGDYGFARKKWTYRLGVEKSLWKKLSLGADLHDIVATQDGWIVSDQEATLLMLLAGTAARDYFRQQGYEVYLGQRLGKAGDLRIGYCSDKYESLPKRSDWSLFNWKGGKRSNPSLGDDEGWINSVQISWRKELLADQYIEVQGELADKELEGDFHFRRCQVELVGHRKLAWEQFLDTRVTLGFADRELPLQRRFQLGGIGTLRGYDYKEFQGDGMLLVQVEYRFKRGDKALVPFVDAGCTWPHNQSIKPEDLRFDGGIGLVWENLRLNLAVAPPRKPRWL
ncbi:MAG: DUF4097 family beta strand repeat protein, partial [Candidatus Latescibacteria bacterium]|nr:DUF4097 family beta strand repeat protein [Candidatus Latescibacterota bacterium]